MRQSAVSLPEASILFASQPNSPESQADRYRIADLLRELVWAQTRFPALFAEPGEARGLFSLAGTLVRTNEVAFKLLACDPDDPLGSATAAIAPACLDEAARRAFALAKTGRSGDVDVRIVPRDGRPAIEFAVTLSPAIVDETIVGVYATARDVTHAKDAERSAARKIAELESLFERHADTMIAVDAVGRVRSVNPAYEALSGYTTGDVVGKPYTELIVQSSFLPTALLFRRVLGGEAIVGGTVLVHRDGTPIEIAGMGVPIVVDGDVVGAYAIGRDVREERRLKRDAHEQSERMRELYLVAASTGQTAEAQLNAALELGCARLRCEGAHLTRIEGGVAHFIACCGNAPFPRDANVPLTSVPECAAVAALAPLGSDATTTDDGMSIGAPIDVGGLRYGAVCFIARPDRAEPFNDGDRDFVRLIGALAASTIERGEQRRRLDALAFFDPLTGLANRRLLEDRLAQAIAHARRERESVAIHFYDLDGFKAINDEHGHLLGDEVLRIIGHRFERITRDVDTIARVGGDEFVVVQPRVAGRADATILAERLRDAVAEPFVLDGVDHRLTMSGGIAIFGGDGDDAQTLLAQADAALYRVKATGRDAIAFAENEQT